MLTEDVKQAYFSLLNKTDKNENDIQRFLEEHTELIPLPFLLGHHLHDMAVISKFPLGNERATDFAYLTKCSDYWEFVLMELEDSSKKIFTKDKEKVVFSADFNHAIDQITSWKAYIDENKDRILYQLQKFRVPLGENPVRFKYVLIYGRNAEKEGSEKRTKMFAQRNTDDTKIMTYDSIISLCEHLPYISTKLIISPWQDQGYKIKKVPSDIHTPIFAYMKPEYLKIEQAEIDELKKQDYQIDAWLSGKMLTCNDKYDRESFAKKTTNPLFKAVCSIPD